VVFFFKNTFFPVERENIFCYPKIKLKMKKTFMLLPAILLLASVNWHCNQENNEPTPELTFNCQESPMVCDLSRANNEFGFNIFKKLHQHNPDKNLFVSPSSIATALTMALNGANGPTADEIKNMLKINQFELANINTAYKTMLNTLPALDNEVTLRSANSIWYRQGFPVKPPFLETNTQYFGSQVQSLDFRNPDAKNVINGWVSDKTRGLIPTIIDNIPDNAIMYLINAMYFKGSWTHEFDKDETIEMPFLKEDQTTTPVDMMGFGGTVKFPLYTDESFYAIDLPYGDSVFSMTLLVPRGSADVHDLMADLSSQSWQQIISGMSVQEMNLRMPKFKMEYEKSLNRALQELGMQTAFTRSADFSNIADAELSVDEVKHKSFIEVNEEGSEAAAVTSIGIIVTSLPTYPDILLNRPFLFAIRENQAGNVLFVGKMMNPNEE